MADLKGLFPGPFAGPEMRAAYETELGKFLVVFNRIENEIRRIIKHVLQDEDHGEIWPTLARDMYKKQVTNLQLLATGREWFPELPFPRMLKLNSDRNLFAHGHYAQDMFSDAFQIVNQQTGEGKDVSIEELKAATAEAMDILAEVEAVWAHIWFEPPEE